MPGLNQATASANLPPMIPSYIKLHRSGELRERANGLAGLLESCRLCPRNCGVNRLKGEKGYCRTGRYAQISAYHLHYGEEQPLVGDKGSGTIFFTHCNLGCVFCQNWDISHAGEGLTASPEQLAGVMLELQNQGAANINFVTPTHVTPQIVEALPIAADHGLNLPLVYNSGGYDSVAALRLLQGIMDIYMSDLKMADPNHAEKYLGARDYPRAAEKAVREMHRQVKDLRIESGLAAQGLMIRHLVMPGGLAGTGHWMRFVANELSTQTYINVMGQYKPNENCMDFPELNRMVTQDEYDRAVDQASRNRLNRLDKPLDIWKYLP